jgi:hypothetical protein
MIRAKSECVQRPLAHAARGSVIWIASALLTATIAHAAEITLLREEPWPVPVERPFVPNCNIRLAGDIAPQDLTKLEQVMRRLRNTKDKNFYLCLDSQGGSYQHGIALARFLLGPDGANLGTVIEAYKGCYSACALIFMAGNKKGATCQFPERYLHVRGKLGFHAPYLSSLGQGSYDRQTVINAFRAAQKGTQQLIEVFGVSAGSNVVSASPWVSPSLFQLLLSQDPETFFMIDNIDKAGRWGISLYGYKVPYYTRNPDFDGIRRACWNTQNWLNDSYATGKLNANAKLTQIELDFGTLGKKTKAAFLVGSSPERYCALISSGATAGPPFYLGYHMLGFHTRSDTDIAPSETVARAALPWMLLPPETTLTQLAREASN